VANERVVIAVRNVYVDGMLIYNRHIVEVKNNVTASAVLKGTSRTGTFPVYVWPA